MTAIRELLPNPHTHETIRFRFENMDYVATLARYPDGRAAEVFIAACVRYGSELQRHLDVAAIAVSLGLQHGIPLDTIRRSLKVGAMYQALAFFDGGPIKAVTP
jgi:ribonucleoside-diphosphate reductase alpha chain